LLNITLTIPAVVILEIFASSLFRFRLVSFLLLNVICTFCEAVAKEPDCNVRFPIMIILILIPDVIL
jgi:hypothetical protein